MKAWLLAAALLAASWGVAVAQPAGRADIVSIGAFVEHRLALQLSDADPAKQALVLSVAYNVLSAYGPDKVAIEVVAFGPGVELLHAGNPNAARIASLVSQGVRFDVCMNTVQTIERDTGKPYALLAQAHHVAAGVAQLLLLGEHGFTVVRP